MYCILEILTTQEDQGIGHVFGPVEDLADSRNHAKSLCELAHKDHPACEFNEIDPDDLDGDDDYQCGFEVYNPETDQIMALYIVKELNPLMVTA